MEIKGVDKVAELNVNKIITELNKALESHDIVFWYDANAEFNESIPEIEDNINASVRQLHKNGQFATKVYLEEHQGERFLVYAPFTRPGIEKNFLADIERYSGFFSADIYLMTLQDVGLPSNQLQFVKEHFKFFGSKERIKLFKKYHNAQVDKHPELGIIATVLKLDRLQLHELLIKLFSDGVEDNKYLQEFHKYGVDKFFWNLINQEFGYVNEEVSLKHLITSFYLNYAYAEMEVDFPNELENFQMDQTSNVVAFMSDFYDSNKAQAEFENYAAKIWDETNLQKYLKKVSKEALQKIDFFAGVDLMLLTAIIDRIKDDDLNAKFGTRGLAEICTYRMAVSKYYQSDYRLLKTTIALLQVNFMPYTSFEDALSRYTTSEYQVDTLYRHFVLLYDELNDPDLYQEIKASVERKYSNSNLNRSIQSWNDVFEYDQIPKQQRQINFYKNYVGPETNRIVVIISDAFRFELAKELQAKLDGNDRISTSMSYMLTNLPSVTYMGMSSLLPHHELNLTLDKKMLLVDGKQADTRDKREKIIQARNGESITYQLDDLLKKNSTELKQKFANQKIVYIYHDQVDSIGDHPKNENEVFKASHESIQEIHSLIESLRTISVSHIIVTADHGYIYRDDKLSESDKIELAVDQPDIKALRYAITAEDIEEMGVGRVPLSNVLDNDEQRFVYYPKSANVFKANGSNNYVHGGSSLQEMVVPVLDVKTSSNKTQAEYVELRLGNSNKRVTSLNVPIRLIQTAPISDKVLPAKYKVYFVDENDRLISNQETVNADSTSADISKQQQQLQLSIRNQTYDKSKDYRLVIENTDSGEKTFEKFAFDITISNDFGFDF